MSPGDAELVELVVVNAAVIFTVRAVFAWDERRMTDAQRARAWPDATRGIVVLAPFFFSPLWLVGVPLHFVRTRRSLRGIGLAILAIAVVMGVVVAVDAVVASVVGLQD